MCTNVHKCVIRVFFGFMAFCAQMCTNVHFDTFCIFLLFSLLYLSLYGLPSFVCFFRLIYTQKHEKTSFFHVFACFSLFLHCAHIVTFTSALRFAYSVLHVYFVSFMCILTFLGEGTSSR